MSFVDELLNDVKIPRMVRVKQHFESPDEIQDIDAKVHAEFSKPEIKNLIKKDMSIAVGLGSRGIAKIHLIARAVIKDKFMF